MLCVCVVPASWRIATPWLRRSPGGAQRSKVAYAPPVALEAATQGVSNQLSEGGAGRGATVAAQGFCWATLEGACRV